MHGIQFQFCAIELNNNFYRCNLVQLNIFSCGIFLWNFFRIAHECIKDVYVYITQGYYFFFITFSPMNVQEIYERIHIRIELHRIYIIN